MDRVLLVTGASSGIGRETAKRAADAGFKVAMAARSAAKLKELSDELGGAGRALAISCDIQDEDDQQAMVDKVVSHFGRLDAVFVNAGSGGSPGGFTGADPESWKQLLLTNVYGAAVTVQKCLPMLRKSRGHVVLTGSIAGRVTISGSMYSASKWAVTAIGHGLREELRGSGIRVTLIEPGIVDTPFFDQRPEGGALQAADVANAVLYALSQPEHVDVNEIMLQATTPVE